MGCCSLSYFRGYCWLRGRLPWCGLSYLGHPGSKGRLRNLKLSLRLAIGPNHLVLQPIGLLSIVGLERLSVGIIVILPVMGCAGMLVISEVLDRRVMVGSVSGLTSGGRVGNVARKAGCRAKAWMRQGGQAWLIHLLLFPSILAYIFPTACLFACSPARPPSDKGDAGGQANVRYSNTGHSGL